MDRTYVRKDRLDGTWKVYTLELSWPVPFPRFPSWREAYDFAYTTARVRHVAAAAMAVLS